MNSWDNPSNKALIDNFPNILAVWGEQTQNHCIDLLKVPPANIKIIGSPQLNMYKKFVTKKNKERVLCFAGSSLGLNETKHLDCIEKIIEEKKINLKVLYKPHPWKSFHKEELFFDESQFKHIKIDKFSKQNYNFRFNGGTFNLDLIKNENTLKTLANIDCLITPLSTIMLEAAICKIPFAVYIPKQKLEMNSSFFGQENNLIYQEFLSRIDCKSFSDYKNYENILLDLIDKCNNNNYRDQLKKDARFFCDLSKDYKKCIGELLNV